jgi:cytochrome d ubiquinol oxidase subunit II
VPLITVIALFGIKFLVMKKEYFKAWISSALTIVSATFFCIIGLYPNLFPSNVDSIYSMTAHNSSASPLTLKIMLIVVLIFIPVVIAYQVWAYFMFSDQLSEDDLAAEEAY